ILSRTELMFQVATEKSKGSLEAQNTPQSRPRGLMQVSMGAFPTAAVVVDAGPHPLQPRRLAQRFVDRVCQP
ncbi:MAG TPA: hypothetical protein VFE63_20080, partial [Roseiarcus sp.]|nr:hypothetical protein [Roseiarcus sp.]